MGTYALDFVFCRHADMQTFMRMHVCSALRHVRMLQTQLHGVRRQSDEATEKKHDESDEESDESDEESDEATAAKSDESDEETAAAAKWSETCPESYLNSNVATQSTF